MLWLYVLVRNPREAGRFWQTKMMTSAEEELKFFLTESLCFQTDAVMANVPLGLSAALTTIVRVVCNSTNAFILPALSFY